MTITNPLACGYVVLFLCGELGVEHFVSFDSKLSSSEVKLSLFSLFGELFVVFISVLVESLTQDEKFHKLSNKKSRAAQAQAVAANGTAANKVPIGKDKVLKAIFRLDVQRKQILRQFVNRIKDRQLWHAFGKRLQRDLVRSF